jgi:hypothetical protein
VVIDLYIREVPRKVKPQVSLTFTLGKTTAVEAVSKILATTGSRAKAPRNDDDDDDEADLAGDVATEAKELAKYRKTVALLEAQATRLVGDQVSTAGCTSCRVRIVDNSGDFQGETRAIFESVGSHTVTNNSFDSEFVSGRLDFVSSRFCFEMV